MKMSVLVNIDRSHIKYLVSFIKSSLAAPFSLLSFVISRELDPNEKYNQKLIGMFKKQDVIFY